MRFQKHFDPITGTPTTEANMEDTPKLRRASKCVCCRCCSTAEYSYFSFCECCGDSLGPWSTSNNAIACLHTRIKMVEEIKMYSITKKIGNCV